MNNEKRDISYLAKDFNQFKSNLIDFTKNYFPNTYKDFNEASPGMLFIEMSAYVADVLGTYLDDNLKETFIAHARQEGNVFDIAATLGYNVKNVIPSKVTIDVYQLLPATGTGEDVEPDFNYALRIKPGMQVKSVSSNSQFRTLDPVDFAFSSSMNPTEVSIYETDDATNTPIYYLAKKSVRAESGEIKTKSFTFNSPVPYDKVVLPDTNIIDIISVVESDGDVWTKVPYMAQDTVFEEVLNISSNDPEMSIYRSETPYLLKLKKTAKRFITRLRKDKKYELQFGAGVSNNNDEEVIPNPVNVGSGLDSFRKSVDIDIDPSNFLYTRAYGQAPSNTTLTVTYTVGNGYNDNVESNSITEVLNVSYDDDVNSGISNSMLRFAKNSVTVNNTTPASGGRSSESVTEIKNNAAANFATQNRIVNKDDYIIRSYSMPPRFGSIAKAYIVPDDQLVQKDLQESRVANPLALNLYILGYDGNKKLTEVNPAIKENLKNYLSMYRMLTDAVNIKNAFIINIGVDFEIIIRPNFNNNEVLLNVINKLKQHFDTDRWQINQPIMKSDVLNIIANVTGVQSVIDVRFTNLYSTTAGYSGNIYNLESAERNNIIYPSLDPSIFEIKYPNQDITGRVVSY